MESELAVVEYPFRGRLAASLRPKELLMSISLTEIVTQLALHGSYRHASDIANRIYHREGGSLFIPETLKARCIRMGNAASSDYMSEACEVLENHGIDKETGIIDDSSRIPESVRKPDLPKAVSGQRMAETVKAVNEGRSEREQIARMEKVSGTEASANDCVYVMIDDVGVKHQKVTEFIYAPRFLSGPKISFSSCGKLSIINLALLDVTTTSVSAFTAAVVLTYDTTL